MSEKYDGVGRNSRATLDPRDLARPQVALGPLGWCGARWMVNIGPSDTVYVNANEAEAISEAWHRVAQELLTKQEVQCLTYLYSPKGGQGCTVTTAMLALSDPGTSLIVDAGPTADMCAALGVWTPRHWISTCGMRAECTDRIGLVRWHPDLILTGEHWGVDNIYVDGRTHNRVLDQRGEEPWAPDEAPGRSLMVIRGCYLALRRAATHHPKPDGIIFIREPGRALTEIDVSAAIGAPIVLTIDIDPSIARAVDAGLLVSRRPGPPLVLS